MEVESNLDLPMEEEPTQAKAMARRVQKNLVWPIGSRARDHPDDHPGLWYDHLEDH